MKYNLIHHSGDSTSRYDKLYKWQCIANGRKNENDYLQIEIELGHYHIRTQVIEETHGYSLYVPMKDAEVAKDYMDSNVMGVFTTPYEDYHVFDKSLHYKNDAFYKERYPKNPKTVTIRRLTLILIVLVAVLLLLKYKFS